MPKRPACLIYCGATHLFVSSGLYYAADLARKFDVHVVLNRQQEAALGEVERAALDRRGVTVHWLESLGAFARHRFFADFVRRLLDEVVPRFVLTLDDIDIFSCYLGREAEGREVPMVCFQSGAFLAASGREQRKQELRYGYAVRAEGLKERGWPLLLADIAVRLESRLRHLFDYWIGPTFAASTVFPGASSLYLRTGYECQRYGRLFLVNQPGAKEFRLADGMRPEQIVSVIHPLTSATGRALYAELYGEPKSIGDVLILISYSLEPGLGHVEETAKNVDRLVRGLSLQHPERRIQLKPHPTMVADNQNAMAQCLRRLGDSIGNVEVIPPAVNALGLLSRAAVVISTPSAVLEMARLFDDRIVVSVSFDTPLRAHPLPDPNGVHYFPSVALLERVDPFSLQPVPRGAGLPHDAVTWCVDEIIEAYAVRHAEIPANTQVEAMS